MGVVVVALVVVVVCVGVVVVVLGLLPLFLLLVLQRPRSLPLRHQEQLGPRAVASRPGGNPTGDSRIQSAIARRRSGAGARVLHGIPTWAARTLPRPQLLKAPQGGLARPLQQQQQQQVATSFLTSKKKTKQKIGFRRRRPILISRYREIKNRPRFLPLPPFPLLPHPRPFKVGGRMWRTGGLVGVF